LTDAGTRMVGKLDRLDSGPMDRIMDL